MFKKLNDDLSPTAICEPVMLADGSMDTAVYGFAYKWEVIAMKVIPVRKEANDHGTHSTW